MKKNKSSISVSDFYEEKYKKGMKRKNIFLKLIFQFEFTSALKGKKINTVLDLGGGIGEFALILQKMGYNVTLIDISESAVNSAKKNGIKNALAVDFLNYKFTEKYDLILVKGFSLLNTDNMTDFKNILEQIKKLKTPDGLIFYHNISNLSGKFINGWFHQDAHSIKPFFDIIYIFPYSGLFSFSGLFLNNVLYKILKYLKVKNSTHILGIVE